jgi:pyruvate dehydrogenase E2 component (dihydrolipoamide acetyltransferase)
MSTIQVHVPDIGDFAEVEVIELMVKVGDTIAKEQSLITVESDKASMEIPSSHAGVVQSIAVKIGDKVKLGSVVLTVTEAAGTAAAPAVAVSATAVAAAPPPVRAEPVEAPVTVATVTQTPPSPSTSSGRTEVVSSAPATAAPQDVSKAHASPSVRAFARELGADLNKIKGTAEHSRITQKDVKAFVKGVMSTPPTVVQSNGGGLNLLPWPKVDFAKFGPIDVKPRSRIQKISGANLARNWAMIPHVTQFDLADITDLEQFRKDSNVALEKQGIKLTMLAFVMKACVAVLKKYPAFNASLDDSGDNLVFKNYYHLGFAADTPNGLVVPVLRDADQKGVAQLAQEMGELAKLARDGKLSPAQMQGASFTISSLGGIGGTAFTPIINAPEVAILGVSKSEIKPVWDGKAFVPRLMLPLSVSYDHRVIDGAQAARFTAELAAVLADMRKVLL